MCSVNTLHLAATLRGYNFSSGTQSPPCPRCFFRSGVYGSSSILDTVRQLSAFQKSHLAGDQYDFKGGDTAHVRAVCHSTSKDALIDFRSAAGTGSMPSIVASSRPSGCFVKLLIATTADVVSKQNSGICRKVQYPTRSTSMSSEDS